MLYPAGRLVDAPLPAWTHRPLFLDLDGHEQQTQGACTIAVHPLLGSHVRLIDEPERHVWHADVGTAVLPWLSDHQVHNVAALPGAAYCEMALAAAGEVFGEASEVRDIAFEQMLCWTTRLRSTPSRRWRLQVSSTSWWRPTRTGKTRGTPPRHCTPPRTIPATLRTTWPPCWRRIRAW